MSKDIISREEALRVINAYDCHELTVEDVIKVADGCANEIIKLPTIDAEPVRHGQNVTPTHHSDMFVCSECGFACEITKLVYEDEDHPEVGPPKAYEYDCKYCPDCGAKMDLEVSSDV